MDTLYRVHGSYAQGKVPVILIAIDRYLYLVGFEELGEERPFPDTGLSNDTPYEDIEASTEAVNQLFTLEEARALQALLQDGWQGFGFSELEPVALPLSEPILPLPVDALEEYPLWSLRVEEAAVLLRGCEFHCGVSAYFDRDLLDQARSAQGS